MPQVETRSYTQWINANFIEFLFLRRPFLTYDEWARAWAEK